MPRDAAGTNGIGNGIANSRFWLERGSQPPARRACGLKAIRRLHLTVRSDPHEQPPAEVGDSGDTEQAHIAFDLLAKMSSARLAPVPARGGHPVQRGAADEHRVGAEHHRLQDVGAAPEPAIDDQRDPVADRTARLGQNVDRRHRPVELAPAMVRDRDRVGADLGGALDVRAPTAIP